MTVLEVRRWRRGPCVVVHAAGELDMSVAPRLDTEIGRALGMVEHPCLVLDLTEISFCDSVGLGVLVGALTRARDAQGRLILVVRPGMVARLLTMTNLDRYIETRGSLREALSVA
ncbi:STAS domain-containing protein [Streptosporangium sp. NPDC001559]|uniref:Anti-sigma factor antagonist n=1 Tax=Streptosporangium jomthongense TaxID=1193683 RepID=A0ABV8F8N6_9ACTN